MSEIPFTIDVANAREGAPRPRFLDHVKDAFRGTASFLYETPLWVVASAVAGIALLFFAPLFALPFLGVAGGVVLSRIVIKIIDINNPELLKSFKEKLFSFQQKHPYIQLLAFMISVIVTIWCPIGGLCLAAPAGLYKGLAVEITVLKTKQNIRRAALNRPSPEDFADIGVC